MSTVKALAEVLVDLVRDARATCGGASYENFPCGICGPCTTAVSRIQDIKAKEQKPAMQTIKYDDQPRDCE